MIAKMHRNNKKEIFEEILFLIQEAKTDAIKYANTKLVGLYWGIGATISEEVKEKGWGKNTVEELSQVILKEHANSRGFSPRNLWRMKQFYETYVEIQDQLPMPLVEISWSNHIHIMSKTSSIEEKIYYIKYLKDHYLSSRDLAKLIDRGDYARNQIAEIKLPTALSVLDKEKRPYFKDSYVFDFLNISDKHTEEALKKGLLSNMKQFLLEMGPNFSPIGDEYIVQVGNKDYRIDILLHHRGLNCLVAIELKTTEFKPEYLGKLEFYLEALDRNEKKEHENPSVGILICRSKDDEVVEYALSRNISPTMVAEYKTQLIDKKILQEKLHELMVLENDEAEVALVNE